MTDTRKPPIEAVRSFRGDFVKVRGVLKASEWHGMSASVEAKFSADLTISEARALAASLITLSDAADAQIAKKAAAEARRQKWRQREIAAGRLKVFSAREFMR